MDDQPELPSSYTLVQPNGEVPKHLETLEAIGRGGSSSVFRARYQNQLDRAVKVLDPRSDLTDISVSEFEASFRNEIEALSSITHENIAKLVDFGLVVDGSPCTFVVTEFIEGLPLDIFAADADTSATDFLSVIDQVLQGLGSLHLHYILHCDIKPANILVRRRSDGTCQATILDLGVSKFLPPSLTESQREEYTYFFTTERYVHPGLRENVSNHSMNRTKVGRLQKMFPSQDMYSFAVSMEELLTPALCDRLRKHLGDEGIDTLRLVISNIKSEGVKPHSAQTLASELKRLSVRQFAPLGIEELGFTAPRGRRISLPAGRILVTGRMQALIDHPLLQRTQRVPQLDLLSHVFPGARHSRYEHALTTLDLARQSVLHLLEDRSFRLNVSNEEIEGYLLMALLGDIGHFQFQHMFEDFLRDRSGEDLFTAGLLTDDEIVRQLLEVDPLKHVELQALVDTKDEQGRTISSIVNEYFHAGWRETMGAISTPETVMQCTLSGLLSSPIDIEKLAYLRLDSSSTGLPFGLAVDPESIFSNLVVASLIDIDQLREVQMKRSGTIGIRESAISYVEASVLARYWQIQRGYWHVTNRSLQAMVKSLIWQLLKNNQLNYSEFLLDTSFMGVDSSLRYLSQKFEALRSQGLLADNATNPIQGLLASQRSIYKRILTISPESNVSSRRSDHLVHESLQRLSPREQEQVTEDIRELLNSSFPTLDMKPGDVLLDIPLSKREMLGGRALVYADDSDELLGDIFDLSPLLEGLKDSFDRYAKRLRVFVHPDAHDALEGMSMVEKAREIVFEHLRSRD